LKRIDLDESYRYCARVAKREAKNFYYSFTVLPPEKRAAMCAVYAFFRYSDDISDEATLTRSKHDLLPKWREALDRAFNGDYGDSKILPAFHDTVKRHGISKQIFHDLIDGTEMDLSTNRYETFEDLYRYCYRVASTVGFVCIHVWGFSGDAALAPSEACGIAFQLTNILRDVKEDAERGRIYLPLEDLRRFNYSEDELLRGVYDERFHALMQFEAARARDYYEQALMLLPHLNPVGLPSFVAMYRIYRGLLDRIEQQDYNVFAGRASLSTPRKLGIIAKAWLGSRLPGGDALLRV
jgi:phytoene synthase